MRVLVSGATGFIGRRLVGRLLQRGDAVSVLSRDPLRARVALPGVEAHAWNAETEPPPPAAFSIGGEPVEAVLHLCGEPVAAGRWTQERKRHIADSRIEGTRRLVETLARLPVAPGALVSASAVGYYGSRGDEELDERSAAGDDFLATVCVGWEREAERAAALGVRVVCCRIGVVIGEDGGALSRLLTPFRLGFGGRLGDGRQWMPWVHVDDVVGLLLHAGGTAAAGGALLAGPLNAVAPAPARNVDFTRELGRALGRPAVIPVPAAALRLALGEMAGVVLASQRVVSRVATASGYQFAWPTLAEALGDAVGRARRAAGPPR
jgi:uncharacterized protein (TIGR01777 family)